MRHLLPFIIGSLFFCSCGTQRDVVQEGRFQRRVHQHGWHIDLHRSQGTLLANARTRMERMNPKSVEPRYELISADQRLLASTCVMNLPGLTSVKHDPTPPIIQAAASAKAPSQAFAQQDGDEKVLPKKKWNKLAIPAFALSLGVVALAVFTASTIAVILAAITALVVAGTSLKQIRRREEAGKGFALVGLIIGLLATLITAAAIGAYGFD